ncbi:Uma2 family endonuclease [Actinocatenispora sera]|uniref:Uma2 family endonuclease n=1 Tax=Actinocatenispora sera TaxID=390989 RepID=UPI0033F6FF38
MAATTDRGVAGEGFTVETAEGLLPPGTRFELHGGNILVMTPATQWHSDVQVRVLNLLRGRGLLAGIEVGVAIAPKQTRVIDVAAFNGERDVRKAYFAPEQIALAVEVVSPSTAENDFRDKPMLYAKLGIPEFWRITENEDEDGDILGYNVEVFVLGERGRYELARTASLDEIEAEGADAS